MQSGLTGRVFFELNFKSQRSDFASEQHYKVLSQETGGNGLNLTTEHTAYSAHGGTTKKIGTIADLALYLIFL